MTVLHFNGQEIAMLVGESVLDALLRNQHAVAFGCRAGVCQSCLMQGEAGGIPASAQDGLTAAQKKLGYFLSCRCIPEASSCLQVQSIQQQAARTWAQVLDITPLNAQVYRLRLRCELDYFPGQYVTLWRNETIARSYSIASVKAVDHCMELHIKRMQEGNFSRWACDELVAGDSLQLQGPMGKCFYAGPTEQPLLLAGLGTGLAPLYGIVRDALLQGHRAPIYLFTGASLAERCYLSAELAELARLNPQLHVKTIAQTGYSEWVQQGDIYQTLRDTLPNLQGFKVFLCGADSFVRKMKKQCFLAGASMADIAADAFLPFVTP